MKPELCPVPFTLKNFPYDCNERFSGAGERADYTTMSMNRPGGEGFCVIKPVQVLNSNDTGMELNTYERIFWTTPARLYSAADLNLSGNSNYAEIGIKSSSPQDTIGFIPISAVHKPPNPNPRALTGHIAQESVFDYLQTTFENQFRNIEQQHIAKIGSKRADLIVAFDDTNVQFEIKSTSTPSSAITLFDKTVRRNIPNLTIDTLTSLMTGSKYQSLEQYILWLREEDQSYGFPGDEGSCKSGKVVLSMNKDNPFMSSVHNYISYYLAENGDSYFAVNCKERVQLYYTGHAENILEAPHIPLPEQVTLRTYGGSSSGGMRIGMKIKI